jgi:hypothetical protein
MPPPQLAPVSLSATVLARPHTHINRQSRENPIPCYKDPSGSTALDKLDAHKPKSVLCWAARIHNLSSNLTGLSPWFAPAHQPTNAHTRAPSTSEPTGGLAIHTCQGALTWCATILAPSGPHPNCTGAFHSHKNHGVPLIPNLSFPSLDPSCFTCRATIPKGGLSSADI